MANSRVTMIKYRMLSHRNMDTYWICPISMIVFTKLSTCGGVLDSIIIYSPLQVDILVR